MSITIIDKSKRSPYFVWKPHPTNFKSTLEEQRYYGKEKEKWIEGDGEIPGTLYFYLKESWIKHRIIPAGHDSVERPKPRMASLWIHQEIKKTRAEKKTQGIFKGRGIGLSSEGGALCNYFAKVQPGSNCIVTSKDQDGISVIFREKIYIPYQHLDSKIRPDELRKSDTKQHCHLRLGVSHKGMDGADKYSISTIELRETSVRPTSPTNFSGQGAAFGFYDEFPLHPRKEELLKSSIECFRNPFTKELNGFLLFGGTFEESMTHEDIAGFRKIVANQKLWKCNILFAPFWWSMYLDEAGYPDEKRAFQWWEQEAESLASDPAKLKAFIRNNPRTLEDIFESDSGGRWEEDVEQTIKLQKTAVLNANPPLKQCNLVFLNGAVSDEPSKNGSTFILEGPKPHCTYMLGVDGVATDIESAGEEGSNMAGVIIKLFDPNSDPFMPVCIHSERPKSIESGYRKLINQAIYYNQFGGFEKIWAEANAATASHFGAYLLANDMKKWISMRKDLSEKGWTDTKKIFQYRTDDLKDFQYKQANIFLRRYAHSIQMLPLIEQMLLPKGDNADILDAWLQFFVAKTNFDEKKKVKVHRKTAITTLVYKNGHTCYETTYI